MIYDLGFQISNLGPIIIPADLTDEQQRRAMAEQVPTLNGVVHCAGIGSRVLCKMLEPDDVQHVMDANISALVLLQTALLQEKKITAGSSIVFIVSAAAPCLRAPNWTFANVSQLFRQPFQSVART